jgi:hypothetical protein
MAPDSFDSNTVTVHTPAERESFYVLDGDFADIRSRAAAGGVHEARAAAQPLAA